MSDAKPIDIGLGLLDHQLVDAEGVRCGKVDDLELEGVADNEPRVVAILVRPQAWTSRGRLGRVAAALSKGGLVRVPWEEVESVGAAVKLRRRAEELRLGRGDRRARPLVERIPGA